MLGTIVLITLALLGALLLWCRAIRRANERIDARHRAAGEIQCPRCRGWFPPDVPANRCHGCGQPHDAAASGMCVCGTCYAAHLASN